MRTHFSLVTAEDISRISRVKVDNKRSLLRYNRIGLILQLKVCKSAWAECPAVMADFADGQRFCIDFSSVEDAVRFTRRPSFRGVRVENTFEDYLTQ